ncbi:DUF7455 domain-containing protein [Mycolicibacterium septicum]|uniref:DUF7455 domain-containing protein n=1 Tax=Mycolicibacterium septicum TaxID=98668 RepID=UPI001AFADF9A|nr:hypothetical protein [Mycolicibacterium septicum]QRY51741.1 hypothetical protein JVX95_30945 [Mycolicibacterium septicum]
MTEDWFSIVSEGSWTIPLTKADRCDRCGAAAKVRATLLSGSELLFCQHHFNEHETSLIARGAVLST